MLLGPCTGWTLLDDAARAIALDLFVDPVGIRALSRYWVASYTDRAHQPLPGPSFLSLLSFFRQLSEQPSQQWMDLRFEGFERDDRHLSFLLSFFKDSGRLCVSQSFLERKAGRMKTIRAMETLLATLSPSIYSTPTTPVAFEGRNLEGIGGEFRVYKFRQNQMLAFYFNPLLFAQVLVDEFVRALALQPLLAQNEGLMAEQLGPLAAFLLNWATKVETLEPLARLLHQHVRNVRALEPLVAAHTERLLNDGSILFKQTVTAWQTSLRAPSGVRPTSA